MARKLLDAEGVTSTKGKPWTSDVNLFAFVLFGFFIHSGHFRTFRTFSFLRSFTLSSTLAELSSKKRADECSEFSKTMSCSRLQCRYFFRRDVWSASVSPGSLGAPKIGTLCCSVRKRAFYALVEYKLHFHTPCDNTLAVNVF